MAISEQQIQAQDARQKFAPQAKSYRTARWLAWFIIFPAWFLMAITIIGSKHASNKHEASIAVLAWVILVVLWGLLSPKLTCPVCLLNSEGPVNKFCPECGSSNIELGQMSWQKFWYFPPQCHTCTKRFRRGKGGRKYSIRYCTHCGAHLDDKGV